MTYDAALEQIEVDLLLEGVYRHYGFDFRNYAPSSIRRRIRQTMEWEQIGSISALQAKILHDPDCMARFVQALSVNVTSMFRDPDFYLAFRHKVVPLLRTYPFIRIWNAGCSTGQEAYSIAILLEEEGLYDRCRIYATDMNRAALEKAQLGLVPSAALKEYAANYDRAGGTGAFSSFYTAANGKVALDQSLRRNIVFAQHNLVTDAPFNEFNVVLCRNVLIYFNKALQDRVHALLYDSLGIFGVLALGKKETIRFTSHHGCYKELDGAAKLYRKVK
jgi:chemotaxis protein methyltransferase CheR